MKKLWNNVKNAVSAFLQWKYRNYVIVVLLFLLWFLLISE